MLKNYILDTNVLIHDPSAIFRFEENNVYIPIYVLEEIDGLKNDPAERGRNAREAMRALDSLRTEGSLTQGIDLPSGGKLIVYSPETKPTLNLATKDTIDNAILQCTLDLKNKYLTKKTILVTMDINVRVRAEALGLQVASYEYQSVDVDSLDNAVISIEIELNDINEFYKQGYLELDEELIKEYNVEINSSVMLSFTPTNQTALGRFRKKNNVLAVHKVTLPQNVFGLKPRNKEQQFALDLLLDDEVKFVTLMGQAGSGKSLLTIAAALYLVLETKSYSRLLISRPIMPLGKDIGYLPGTVEEKLGPWMKPIHDNLDYLLMSGKAKSKYNIDNIEKLFETRTIEIEPIVYIRGRSIIDQLLIVDESQSLTPHEIKTIISRCGENTKVIFTGDIDQIDNPYVTKATNGLSAAVKKIRNNAIAGHIKLEKGERSALANLAVENL